MREASTVKIISETSQDIDDIIQVLEKGFNVVATSSIIFDDKTKKYHRFVSVTQVSVNEVNGTNEVNGKKGLNKRE